VQLHGVFFEDWSWQLLGSEHKKSAEPESCQD